MKKLFLLLSLIMGACLYPPKNKVLTQIEAPIKDTLINWY